MVMPVLWRRKHWHVYAKLISLLYLWITGAWTKRSTFCKRILKAFLTGYFLFWSKLKTYVHRGPIKKNTCSRKKPLPEPEHKWLTHTRTIPGLNVLILWETIYLGDYLHWSRNSICKLWGTTARCENFKCMCFFIWQAFVYVARVTY